MLQKGGIKYIGYNLSQVVPKVTKELAGEIIRAGGRPFNINWSFLDLMHIDGRYICALWNIKHLGGGGGGEVGICVYLTKVFIGTSRINDRTYYACSIHV